MTLLITLTIIYILSAWRMWYILRYTSVKHLSVMPICNTLFCLATYKFKREFKPNKPLK